MGSGSGEWKSKSWKAVDGEVEGEGGSEEAAGEAAGMVKDIAVTETEAEVGLGGIGGCDEKRAWVFCD